MRWILTVCLLLCGNFTLFADNNINVSATIDPYQAQEGIPLYGTISITHDTEQKVDVTSFKLEGESLPVNFVKDVTISPSSSLKISIYSFEIPEKSKGLYMLPSISVKVADTVYQSMPSSFEVKGRTITNGGEKNVAALILKAFINRPSTMYPGQHVIFLYRFLFQGNIELTKEYLPLLDAEGFEKIGDTQVKNYTQDSFNVQEVSQEAKAIDPGTFSFPPSYVEGYAFREDILKRKTLIDPKMHSEAPAITLEVLPFPQRGKPRTFNGAVGEFTFKTELLTTPTIDVNDKMKLALIISGLGDMSTVEMPPLRNQALKSLFKLSDLPPSVEMKNGSKHFVIELYPLTTEVSEIPSLSFSSFNPLSNSYVTVSSDPIPITVKKPEEKETAKTTPDQQPVPTPPPEAPSQPDQTINLEQVKPAVPPPIEIERIYALTGSDVKNRLFSTWTTLWSIPFVISLFLLQMLMKKYRSELFRTQPAKSEELLNKVSSVDRQSPEFFNLLRKTLMVRLLESGMITSSTIDPEELPHTGVSGEVRDFLCNIEKKRFSGESKSDAEQDIEITKKLYAQIGKTTSTLT